MDPDLLLLGEPLPLELANSLYVDDDARYDVLDEAGVAWLAALGLPGVDAARRLIPLRSALRPLFAAHVQGEPLPSYAVAVLDEALVLAPSLTTRVVDGVLHTRRRDPVDAAGVVGLFAVATVELLRDHGDRIRRCDAPDCPFLFRQQHRRRRFCTPSCSGRLRQAAYRRRRG